MDGNVVHVLSLTDKVALLPTTQTGHDACSSGVGGGEEGRRVGCGHHELNIAAAGQCCHSHVHDRARRHVAAAHTTPRGERLRPFRLALQLWSGSGSGSGSDSGSVGWWGCSQVAVGVLGEEDRVGVCLVLGRRRNGHLVVPLLPEPCTPSAQTGHRDAQTAHQAEGVGAHGVWRRARCGLRMGGGSVWSHACRSAWCPPPTG